jgi:phenylalanyl-tRNA synthetase beta chain
MKISYNWLTSILKTDKSPEEISALLTSCGLEVEGLEPFESIRGGLKGLVIGEVIEKEKHPDADRLSVTKVRVGDDASPLLQIVCGAPNVAAGQKVIVAPVDCEIFPISGEPFTIKKSKIRGQLSEGMICADDEVGLGNSHDGIRILPEDAPVGTLLSEYMNPDADVVDAQPGRCRFRVRRCPRFESHDRRSGGFTGFGNLKRDKPTSNLSAGVGFYRLSQIFWCLYQRCFGRCVA